MSDVLSKCPECGDPTDDGDRCEECYYDMTVDCTLCCERIERDDASDFILCKAEFSTTGRRPPGIYRLSKKPFMTVPMIGAGWLHSNAVVFVDKLPDLDRRYELSGYTCDTCAAKYDRLFSHVYGEDNPQWEAERAHTRETILQNRNMLRDLECDQVHDGLTYANANKWHDLRDLYELPELPTYHEWLFVDHAGVKVFDTCDPDCSNSFVGWWSLRPEPRYRAGAGRLFPETFADTSLPTHGGFEKYNHRYYYGRTKAREAIITAIDQGLLRQDGCYDESGNPTIYG